MGCLITPDNRLEEEMVLAVSGRCPACGIATSEASEVRAAAGRIGIADLVEAASVRADGAAGCGHPVAGLRGVVTAHYRLPGSSRWIGAHLELAGGRSALRLASVDTAALDGRTPSLLPAGTGDHELAHLLGQPAGVAAAWHGALLADRLGHAAHFPCGPNLTLLVAADRSSARRRAEELGWQEEPVCLGDCGAACASLAPSAWLGDGALAQRLWALVGSRGLVVELTEEARAHGLGVATSAGQLRLSLRSELLFEELELGPIVERALAHARHPRVEAAYDLLDIRRRLTRRAEVLQSVLRHFEPEDWRMAPDGRCVVLRREGIETELDLSQLAIATPRTLPGLLRSVAVDGGFPGEHGPRA